VKTKTCFIFSLFCLFCLILCPRASATIRVWTNTLGGSWHVAANWKPAGVPSGSDGVYITNNGTYTVYLTNTVTIQSGVLGGNSGAQTLVVDNPITFTCALWHVYTNGYLVMSNGTYSGHIVLHTNGVMRLEGAATKVFADMWFLNYGGTVLWRDGTLVMNGTIAWVQNDGLWRMEGNNYLQASAGSMWWTNNGVFQKVTGTGEGRIYGFNLVNNPGGLVDIQSGTLFLLVGQTNILNGTFNTAAGATMTFTAGACYDAGAVFTGAGSSQFYSATMNLRTNTLPGLKYTGGQIVLGTNFQKAGAITNLAIDGANLNNTNLLISGTLTINSGSWADRLTVQPGGKLIFATAIQKNLSGKTLINQGTVDWTGGTINLGGFGVVSNGGVWKMEGDDELYSGGGGPVLFTNGGIFYKSAGAGGSAMTRLEATSFINLTSGLVQVDAGILRMPQNYTNTAGTLHLNGGGLGGSPGAFSGFGPIYMTSGTLDGNGTLASSIIASGGTISPGNSPGAMQFSSGLTMNAGSTLAIDGTGTVPGTGYDQLSVTGAVAISNCTLQVTSFPAGVPSGTTFTIIQNDNADAVQGTFNGLPENSVFNSGGQSYRIHYGGGTGNDVTLVNESGPSPIGPILSDGGYANGTFHLLGSGNSTLAYTIQASTNLQQWTNIGSATGDVSGAFNFTDTNASKFRYRFYRTTN